MFDRTSLHIALLLWGCIFSLIAALCMFMSKNFDQDKRRWMIWIQITCAGLLLADSLAWTYRGVPGQMPACIVHVSNFLVFALSDILLFLYNGYMSSCLFKEKKDLPHKRLLLVSAVAFTGLLLVIVSQFTNLYYYIDAQNYYHRNPAYVVSTLLPAVGMIIDLSIMIEFRKNVSRAMLVSLISYMALPFAASVIQIFCYGISLINISISISMILMFVVAMIEQNENLARKEREAADLRISMMISQIAPHFIYNALTTIQQMCVTDAEMASETVGEFADYLRGNLKSLEQKEAIPFGRELEHVRCYAAIEKKRFGARVQVVYDIETENFLIPALTLQPIVENAIKHGLCKKKGGGTVWIHTKQKGDMVIVSVEDDGAGFDTDEYMKTQQNHVGIRNVMSRLNSMCKGELTIDSRPGQGTCVRIYLPQSAAI